MDRSEPGSSTRHGDPEEAAAERRAGGRWPLVVSVAVAAAIGGIVLERLSRPAANPPQPPPPRLAQEAQPSEPPGRFPEESPPGAFPTIDQLKAEGERLAARLIESFPDQAEALVVAGIVYDILHDAARAGDCYEKALRLDPGSIQACYHLGLLARQVGDSQKAVGYLRKVFAADPELGDAQLCLGDSLLLLGEAKEAVALLEQGNGLARFGAIGQFVLGQAYLQSGDCGKARQCYEAAVRLDPGFSNAHCGLANVLARLGQEEKAREHREIVARLREQFLAGGGPSRAAQVQMETAVLCNRLARCYLAAAEVHRRLGRAAETEEFVRRAEALGLGTPPAEPAHGVSTR
jgi:tetratricopeptide (TPR) repeat protein